MIAPVPVHCFSISFIKTLQNMCFNYLCKNGPDEIKMVVKMQGYENGGLRMIDISQFINTLKISWIRRPVTENRACFIFHNTLYPFCDKCLKYGRDYVKSNQKYIG